MSFEEMIVALIGAIGAFALVGYLGAKIFDLIKAWINRGKSGYDEETFERLAKAFVKHKKEMEQRVQNLEAALAGEEKNSSSRHLENPKNTIEIDEDSDHREGTKSGSGSLDNMLRE